MIFTPLPPSHLYRYIAHKVIYAVIMLAVFYLSSDGWEAFGKHFTTPETRRRTLTRARMADCRSAPADGGHAVVLTNCEPKSLTLLNLWGTSWGNEGSFRIEDHTVLELDVETARMSFYDVFWVEDDLRMLRRRLSISR